MSDANLDSGEKPAGVRGESEGAPGPRDVLIYQCLQTRAAGDRDNLSRDEFCHWVGSISKAKQLQCGFVGRCQARDIIGTGSLITQEPLDRLCDSPAAYCS
jgi:hypothetical protein